MLIYGRRSAAEEILNGRINGRDVLFWVVVSVPRRASSAIGFWKDHTLYKTKGQAFLRRQASNTNLHVVQPGAEFVSVILQASVHANRTL